jgi:hypothetical protein
MADLSRPIGSPFALMEVRPETSLSTGHQSTPPATTFAHSLPVFPFFPVRRHRPRRALLAPPRSPPDLHNDTQPSSGPSRSIYRPQRRGPGEPGAREPHRGELDNFPSLARRGSLLSAVFK